MNEVIENIKGRRSIRVYEERQVEDEKLEMLIDAAKFSPNAGNLQQTRMVVIQDPEILDRIGKIHGIILRKYNKGEAQTYTLDEINDPKTKSAFYNAPTAIALFAPERFYFSTADSNIMGYNIALAAHSIGLGTVIVSECGNSFAGRYGQGLLREWGIPEGYAPYCYVLVGYSAQKEMKDKIIKYADAIWAR